MTEELRRKFKDFLRKRDAEGLESLWLDLLASDEDLSSFLELADRMAKAELRESASTFLSLLASQRKEHEDNTGMLEVLKRLARLNPEDRYLRREMIVCYQQIHAGNPRLETYISKSELADDRPVAEAVQFLENCLAFDVGQSVHDPEQGLGKITELDLMVDKLVVDFGRDKPVPYHINAAFKHLEPLRPEHFLIRRRDKPDALRALVRQNPIELLKAVLSSFDRGLKPKEIREYLTDIVPAAEWDGFWAKVLKTAGADPSIRVQTKPERSYQWSGSAAKPTPEAGDAIAQPLSPAGELAHPRRTRTRARPEPLQPESPAPEPAATAPGPVTKLPRTSGATETKAPGPEPPKSALRTAEEFVVALKSDPSPEHWKEVLARAQETLKDDWVTVYRQAFFETTDKRAWARIARQLGARPGAFSELAQEVTTYFKKYTPQFLFLQRNREKYGLKSELVLLVSRLLDLLESDKHKSYWPEVKNWLAERNDALLYDCFKAMTEEEAEQLWSRISRMRYFEDYRKDEIRELAQRSHPKVGAHETKAEDYIYNTKQGIERKEVELRQLLEVEIPKTSEDIGRAREMGDLSENYEFKAARERQVRLLARVSQIQRDLAIARRIDPDQTDTSKVGIGTRVRVEETPSAEIQEFMILGPWDIDPDKGIISYQAPLAQRLLGKRVGDFVPLSPNLPGNKGHKVLEIKKAF